MANGDDYSILSIIDKYKSQSSIIKIKEAFVDTSTFSVKDADHLLVIKGISEIKSLSIDSVLAKILKDHYDISVPKVVIDFNSSIRTGFFFQ